MDDLISRQAAIDEAEEWIEAVYCDREEQRERSAIKKVIQGIKALPSVQLATDTNVGTKLGTNLAEVGTDCMSRQAAIDAARDWYDGLICGSFKGLEKRLRALPPAQPEIICCKDCKHYEYGICKKTGLCVNKSPNGFCDWGER